MLLKKEKRGLGKDCITVKSGGHVSDEVYVYSMGMPAVKIGLMKVRRCL